MSNFSRRAKSEAAKYQHMVTPRNRHKYEFGCGSGSEGNKGFQPGNTCAGEDGGGADPDDAAAKHVSDNQTKVDRLMKSLDISDDLVVATFDEFMDISDSTEAEGLTPEELIDISDGGMEAVLNEIKDHTGMSDDEITRAMSEGVDPEGVQASLLQQEYDVLDDDTQASLDEKMVLEVANQLSDLNKADLWRGMKERTSEENPEGLEWGPESLIEFVGMGEYEYADDALDDIINHVGMKQGSDEAARWEANLTGVIEEVAKANGLSGGLPRTKGKEGGKEDVEATTDRLEDYEGSDMPEELFEDISDALHNEADIGKANTMMDEWEDAGQGESPGDLRAKVEESQSEGDRLRKELIDQTARIDKELREAYKGITPADVHDMLYQGDIDEEQASEMMGYVKKYKDKA